MMRRPIGCTIVWRQVLLPLNDNYSCRLGRVLPGPRTRVAGRVAPLAETEMRGRVLEKGLNGVTDKIAALLEGGVVESERRASLNMALGVALATLGQRESGTESLEQAVAAFTEALQECTRERVPLEWAATQNNLGAALATLGEREPGDSAP